MEITPLFASGLALLAAASWGSADFSGGLAARRSTSVRTVLLSYCVGLAATILIAVVRAEPIPALVDLAWGAAAGLSGMLGVGFLFQAYQAGRMGIASPISAVLSTALPVLFNALTQGLPGTLQLIGFGVALGGIWLLARPEEDSGIRPAGLGYAVLGGLGFGGFFIGLGQIGPEAVFWPIVAGRAVSILAVAAFAFVTRRPMLVRGTPWGLLVLVGVLDVAGNLFFLLAVQNGRLDVTSVLGSLYPAVTVVLAWLILKERLTRLQVVGVAVALLSIALITA